MEPKEGFVPEGNIADVEDVGNYVRIIRLDIDDGTGRIQVLFKKDELGEDKIKLFTFRIV